MGSEEKREKTGFWPGKKGGLLLFLSVVGVLLLLFGDRIPQLLTADQNGGKAQEETPQQEDEVRQYASALTKEIEGLCASLQGVGEVRAAVSLQGGFTYLYATDSEKRHDAQGQQQSSQSYLTVGSGASEHAVLVARIPPAISGIGIVCEGGGDAAVRAELIALLSAAYDVGSNRIYVACSGQ